MGVLKRFSRGARNIAGEATKIYKDAVDNPALTIGAALTGGVATGALLPTAHRVKEDLLNPKIPGMDTTQDKSFLAGLAQDEARRRRGLAGRSLLRSSFAGMLGRSGSGTLGKGA